MGTIRLLGAAGLTVVLATSASAAGFNVNEAPGDATLADISTGSVTVADCTSGLRLDVVPAAFDATLDGWPVAAIRVTDVAGVLDASCAGSELVAVIEHGQGVTATSTHVLGVGDTVVELTPVTSVLAGSVTEVSVLVDNTAIAVR